jgi:hypothetical protein
MNIADLLRLAVVIAGTLGVVVYFSPRWFALLSATFDICQTVTPPALSSKGAQHS